jgi:hypothetical protein
MFVRAKLPLAECVVLGKQAHREFLEQIGLEGDFRTRISQSGGEGDGPEAPSVRLSHMSSPIGGELNRQICEALMALGAPSVAVVSESLVRRHLKSIPEVKDAIKEAWLSLEGLRRQVEAASRGEVMPTWPVYVLVEDGAPVS